ncbi:MAG: glycosyltransferase family 4 protein [Polyangiaceae bacterium]|nr:glycosyltransferase family 4 protein [Polyangiaceae bacterium]
MRVVAITKIFPNGLEPLSSPFNRQQFEALKNFCDLRVLEAIPYVPFASMTGLPERAAKLSKLPKRETLHGISTHYVKQLYIPRFFLPANLPLYAASLAPHWSQLAKADVLLGTWAYPDGCAAIAWGKLLGKPVVVKVHGSDINLLAKRQGVRSILKSVLPHATSLVSVSRALSKELAGLGVREESIFLVPNGVNSDLFYERDKAESRKMLGLATNLKWVMFCGRLEKEKGLTELLAAFRDIATSREDVGLALIGEGVMRKEVDALVETFGERVQAPGARPLEEVAVWHGAADLFVLPSWNEGTPNVVLEALASGRPAVGTRVGGIPDVIDEGKNGFLVPPRDPARLREALSDALNRNWDSRAIAASGPISWKESAQKLCGVLEAAVASRA